MAMPVSRSLRSLADDHPRRLARGVAAIALFLLLWVAWLVLAELPVYKTSDNVLLQEQQRQLYAVATFEPGQALGRIHEGQTGWLQIAGFSPLQYGKIPVTVRGVAAEAPGGPVRVELTLSPQDLGGIPLQAGMPGRVEIVIERAAPATLLLRTVGGMLGGAKE